MQNIVSTWINIKSQVISHFLYCLWEPGYWYAHSSFQFSLAGLQVLTQCSLSATWVSPPSHSTGLDSMAYTIAMGSSFQGRHQAQWAWVLGEEWRDPFWWLFGMGWASPVSSKMKAIQREKSSWALIPGPWFCNPCLQVHPAGMLS